jgi:DNA-binding response OmpR family regulator
MVNLDTPAAIAKEVPRRRASAQVLVVGDLNLVGSLKPVLVAEGFGVEVADSGNAAVALARGFLPEIVILEVGAPAFDGIEACQRIRGFSDAYVVMVSVRNSELDVVVGLSVGADDYVTMPYSLNELLARLRAMLRRPRGIPLCISGADAAVMYSIGPLTVDIATREVTINGAVAPLTRIEFELLAALCGRPNQCFSRVELLHAVWGPDWVGAVHVVDVHMTNLRRKLRLSGETSPLIKTVRSIGFRLNYVPTPDTANCLTRSPGMHPPAPEVEAPSADSASTSQRHIT